MKRPLGGTRRLPWATPLVAAAAGILAVSGCGGEDSARSRPTPLRGATTVHVSSVNLCPEITLMLVAPLQTSVGHTIDLFAETRDPDGDVVLPFWNSTDGPIAEPEATETTYLCDEHGERVITFAVLDEGGCEQRLSTPIRCE